MKIIKFFSTAKITTLFLVFIALSKLSFAQNSALIQENPSSTSVENSEENNNKPILSQEVLKETLDEVLSFGKTKSLMFDKEENNNINRAIDSLKNNQTFIPEGLEDQTQNDDPDKEKKQEAEAQEAVLEEQRKNQANEKSYIYLASILYSSGKKWIVWINEQKITNESNSRDNELHISNVKSDRAKIVWKMSVSKWKILSGKNSEEFAPKINENNQVEIEFELKPNQTFVLSTNSVFEGKASTSYIKKKDDDRRLKLKNVNN